MPDNHLRIAVDAMGGDHAPAEIVRGAYRSAAEDGTWILLVGDRERLGAELSRLGAESPRIEIVHAEEAVGMAEPAVTPIRRKRRASVRVCAELVRDGRAGAMLTAGHTGAAMVAAKMVLGTLPGVDRPALAAVLPNRRGRTVLLDVGANVDSRPEHLRQFAVMGHFYAQEVLGIQEPRVGLLSIGEEEEKGNEVTRRGLRALRESGIRFAGNIEGRDLFSGNVDVAVCDGFVGNLLLKSAEAMAELLTDMLRAELGRDARSRVGTLLAAPALESLKARTDYRELGAAPLLGLDGGCFIAHGRSTSRAIQSALRRAVEFAAAGVHRKIREKVAVMRAAELRLGSEAAS
ncbi:MAG: phosphate acyltransferase PlsX [Thermoanaerobaculia bacterium]|nr:phosphate acyltransferase PlsX [Thermoanaerobaculia bacterium]